MTARLFCQAMIKFFAGLVIVSGLLFVSAGTMNYPQGWLLICSLFVPMLIAGIFMMFKAPELLKKRLNAKEKESEQKAVVALSGLMFFAAFLAAGFSFRFEFLMLPIPVSTVALFIFLAAYIFFAEVLRENECLSRTIEVQQNQKVIDTGLYGIIRHPMYSSTLVLFLAMPLVLGSTISFIIMLSYIPIIVKSILNEEKVLAYALPGYADYLKKVKYRLIPYIW